MGEGAAGGVCGREEDAVPAALVDEASTCAGAPATGVEGFVPSLFSCFSISAFSSSVIMVEATDVMSFMIEISPILVARRFSFAGVEWL